MVDKVKDLASAHSRTRSGFVRRYYGTMLDRGEASNHFVQVSRLISSSKGYGWEAETDLGF